MEFWGDAEADPEGLVGAEWNSSLLRPLSIKRGLMRELGHLLRKN